MRWDDAQVDEFEGAREGMLKMMQAMGFLGRFRGD